MQLNVDSEILAAYRGRLMRKTDASAFKIVVCLGPDRSGTKMRLCVWSENQRKWSKPQTRPLDKLAEIASVHDLKMSQRRAVTHAWQAIEAKDGVVIYGTGTVRVGKPWLNKSADKRTTAHSGITQLSATTAVLTSDGSRVKAAKLSELNRALSGWMFGGRK